MPTVNPTPAAPRRCVFRRTTRLDALVLADWLLALETWCDALPQANSRLSMQVQLAAEEWLVNLSTHAQLGDTPAQHVRLLASAQAGNVHLRMTDDGAAFDPWAQDSPDLQDDWATRDPGGLGLHLIRQLARQTRYKRVQAHHPAPGAGRNQVDIWLGGVEVAAAAQA